MTQPDHVRNVAAEVALNAVSSAGTNTQAQTRLRHAMGSLMPALRMAAAQEHAAEIKSFVNPARIDIEVSVVTRNGDVISTGGEHGT